MPGSSRDVRPEFALIPVLVVVALLLAVHLACLTAYGWFRDELYYLVCADHVAWGYVDQPPFSIAALAAWRGLFGESIAAIRMAGVLMAGVTAMLAAMLAREFGGRWWAQAMAALTMAVAPVMLGTMHVYSMNAWDVLLWGLAYLAVAHALRDGSSRRWAWLGLVLGIGMLNKISVLWLIGGLGAGLVFSSHRRVLLGVGPWLAGAIAAGVFAPHIIWQMQHQWPTLEFMRNATHEKMVSTGAIEFVLRQLLVMGPADLPCLLGLAWLLFARVARPWRLFGIAFLAIAAVLMLGGRSRASYLAPGYLPLLAAGGVALEACSTRRMLGWVRVVLPALLLAMAILFTPLALPLLPVERYIARARALGLSKASEEHHRMGELPQHFADMHGWPELEDEVAKAYRSLPPEERDRCAIFGQNYGEAGAVTVLGRHDGLPPAISGHNNFWLWGPGHTDGRTVIVIGGDEVDNRAVFDSLERVGTWNSPYAMPYEQDTPIWVGRGLKGGLAGLWPRLKNYN